MYKRQRLAPLHDLADLRPVIHVLVLIIFHRRARDDHAVKTAFFDLIEGDVKFIEMAGRRVLRHMGGQHQKGDVHLDRRVGQSPQKLGLRVLLNRHQI